MASLDFDVGTRVLTRRNDELSDPAYYAGFILQVNGDGTYDISCDDGDSLFFVETSFFHSETEMETEMEPLRSGFCSISIGASPSPVKNSTEDYFGELSLTDTLNATDKASCREYADKLVRSYFKKHSDAPADHRTEIPRMFTEAMTGFVPATARSRLALIEAKVKHLEGVGAIKHKTKLVELEEQYEANYTALIADAESKERHFNAQGKTLGSTQGYFFNARYLPATSVELGRTHYKLIGEIQLEMKRMSDHHAELIAKKMAVYVLSEQEAAKAKQKAQKRLGFSTDA